MNLEEKFKTTIRQYHMLKPGGRVLAAVSGGADSVCLLALFDRARQELGLEIRAVHINHGLRGAEADGDEEAVRRLCGRLKAPLKVYREDVAAEAERKGISQEEAGRLIRYARFEETAREWEEEAGGPVAVAVAHHKGDQAETILHNLIRGSGLRGLGGMEPVRGRIIRPLLEIERGEIIKWLLKEGLAWRQDSSNDSDLYTRNRIRRRLLPLIEEEISPGGADSIIRMGLLARQADGYLREQAASWLAEHKRDCPGGSFLADEDFNALAPVLKSYCLLRLIREAAGEERDVSFIHVEQALGLFKKQVGKEAALPRGVRAVRRYGGVFIGRPPQKEKPPIFKVEMQVFPYKKGAEIPKNQYTKWFDYDKIKGTPVLRGRQEGDFITLPGGKRKTLKRFMIDEKIPAQERKDILLLADGSHIMWIIGRRISEYYKIGPDTRQVLAVRLRREEENQSVF